MWEAETRRILLPGLAKKFARPYVNEKKLHVAGPTFHPSNNGKQKIRSWLSWAKSESQKIE
jgi:hypothetical protein